MNSAISKGISLLLGASVIAFAAQGCGNANKGAGFDDGTTADDGGSGTPGDGTGTDGGPGGPLLGGEAGPPKPCAGACSPDMHAVLDCNGNVVQQCSGTDGCDAKAGTCKNACDAARSNQNAVGCEYYATDMDSYAGEQGYCFAVFVANTWNAPAHVTVDYAGQSLQVASFARIPQGAGQSLTYQPYDAAAGIAPGEVAVLFLVGTQGSAPSCPVAGAMAGGVMLQSQSGIGKSFHIQTDVPVVSYQINPYGGGSSAVTGASLLLPTSAWDKNYVAVNAYQQDIANPSLNVVAMEDGTTVKMVPVAAVQGGGGLPSGAANTPLQFTLNKGEHAQFSQADELTGSVLSSDKPIGLMGGHACLRIPAGVAYCDHAEQMIPPVRALGSEYVGAMYRARKQEPAIWRVVGAVDGTVLDWSSNVGGPNTLNRGTIAEFQASDEFVVKSQDKDHPFMLFTYMSGSTWKPGMDGYGDADFVTSVPSDQYLPEYVFFADPTYPETNLVLVQKANNGKFDDVSLDCAGTINGWKKVGTDYQIARIDLMKGNFQNQGGCSTGRHVITSKSPFGLWVWGWGTPETSIFTQNVSYGYPGGMNVTPINSVVIPPTPK